MSLMDILFGRPLATSEEKREKIGSAAGVPIFGLDALGSVAYGPEAALTVLIPLGAGGVSYILPITACIIGLLAIVYFSYRQTIAAYPHGGGSYSVVRENLGTYPGLLAATALLIDYILVAAVGISAGVGALVSAIPSLLPHTLPICLAILLIITTINLRGVRDVGKIFMIPTYSFIAALLLAISIGLTRTALAEGHPSPVQALPSFTQTTTTTAGFWLLLQSFANGCTAMTGVEAVSNGVAAFKEPSVRYAQRTLTIIIGLLILMLAAIAYLARTYHIVATKPGEPGYQSVLSMLLIAVSGRGLLYYASLAAILLVLTLQANTAFADFPRVCRAIAQNSFLPHSFAIRGRRLVHTQGILVLATIVAILLVFFRGITDRLIPLFAIGAFLAFTMSQAGMVGHWKRTGGRGARHSILVNGLGALTTGLTLLIVLVAKFSEGAWIIALLVPFFFGLMLSVRRHYDRVARDIETSDPLHLPRTHEHPIVIVPIECWNMVSKKALEFAFRLSPEVYAVHISTDEATDRSIQDSWARVTESPANRLGVTPPKLVVVPSPYRFVLSPIVSYVLEMEKTHPGRQIVLLVPELVERSWYRHLLYESRAEFLRALLLLKGNEHIAIVTLPLYPA